MGEVNGGAPSIEDRLRRIAVLHLDVEADKVTKDADFIDNLGADSLDLVELTMACEEEFDVEIPDDDAEKFKTFGDAVAYVTERLKTPA